MAHDVFKICSISLLTFMCFYVFLGCNTCYKNDFQKSKYCPQGYFSVEIRLRAYNIFINPQRIYDLRLFVRPLCLGYDLNQQIPMKASYVSEYPKGIICYAFLRCHVLIISMFKEIWLRYRLRIRHILIGF